MISLEKNYSIKYDNKGLQQIYFKGERLTHLLSSTVHQNMNHKILHGKRLCTIKLEILAILPVSS